MTQRGETYRATRGALVTGMDSLSVYVFSKGFVEHDRRRNGRKNTTSANLCLFSPPTDAIFMVP